jgi:hypothetical protein
VRPEYADSRISLVEEFTAATRAEPGNLFFDWFQSVEDPNLYLEADVVVSDGEYVVGRWTMTGTNTGAFDLFGLPPTGRPVTMTGQEIFRAREGRFVEVWHQEDVGGMLNALGLEPPQLMMRLAAKRSARKYSRQRRD